MNKALCVCCVGVTSFITRWAAKFAVFFPIGAVAIASTHCGGMARLSLPGRLVITEIDFPAPGVEPGYGRAHPSTNRARRMVTSLIDRDQRVIYHKAKPPRSSRNFVRRSPVAVARSSSGGVAICYILPVVWMTLHLAVVGRMAMRCDTWAESDVYECLVIFAINNSATKFWNIDLATYWK